MVSLKKFRIGVKYLPGNSRTIRDLIQFRGDKELWHKPKENIVKVSAIIRLLSIY
jgi:hypothetical protein